MADPVEKYNVWWPADMHPMEIERECIRQGGYWMVDGEWRGAGLFEHFVNLQKYLWPEDDHHRWSNQILKSLLEERITILTGARDTGKTGTIARWVLADYWCFPHNTLVIMTSTTTRGLRARIFSEVVKLFVRAKEIYPQLEGYVIEASIALFTDKDTRDIRKGMFGVPCLDAESGSFLGSAVKEFAGIKQERRRLISDELQYMPVDYLKVLDDMDKGEFKMAGAGNPIAGNGKALDRIAEPTSGWASLGEVTKTREWRNKYGGKTINLVGTDSPNFDKETLNRYSYMLNQKDVDSVSKRPGGKDSLEWWSKIMGIRKAGVVDYRVLTVDLVETRGGFTDCKWEMEPEIKVIGIDAGYGGDPCILTWAACGKEVGKGQVMRFGEQEEIPILLSTGVTAEKQIAIYVRKRCEELGVAPEGVFAECGMRATLMVELALIVGVGVNAVNAGGPATQRPVNNDFYINDESTGQKRLKTCYEHYSKFVTELAFSVRELVMGGQARKFPRAAAEEFEQRESRMTYNDRIELETKPEFKKRMGSGSPNNSDSTAICVEGARRMGFVLERVADGTGKPKEPERDWLGDAMEEQRKLETERELVYQD